MSAPIFKDIKDFVPDDRNLAQLEKMSSNSKEGYVVISKKLFKTNPDYNMRKATDEEVSTLQTKSLLDTVSIGFKKLAAGEEQLVVPLKDFKEYIKVRNFTNEIPGEGKKRVLTKNYDHNAYPKWMRNSEYTGEVDFILTSNKSGPIARPQGAGTIKLPGGTYEGNFVNGKPTGQGTFTSHGITFTSDLFTFVNDKIQTDKCVGKRDGVVVYEGAMVQGIFHGKGKYKDTDGSVYEGDWVNGERHGNGTITYANGDGYTGKWEHNKYGTRTFERTEVHNETDRDETYVINQNHGIYKHVYENGDIYEGHWSSSKIVENYDLDYGYAIIKEVTGPHGMGKMTYANGDVYEGKWRDGSPTKY